MTHKQQKLTFTKTYIRIKYEYVVENIEEAKIQVSEIGVEMAHSVLSSAVDVLSLPIPSR
jgi:hypothetical protein